MNNNDKHDYTSRKNAKSFDANFSKLSAIKNAQHLCMRTVLANLADDAHILCVGAGTGAELFYLADEFPGWRFTVVEPAKHMLEICKEQAEEKGISSRCVFHEGYVATLENGRIYDAATSILVTHFLLNIDDRYDYYREVASRLKSGGFLVNVELSSDMESVAAKNIVKVWRNMMEYSGLPASKLDKMISFEDVLILPQKQVETIIKENGFEEPVLFYQALLIHGWYTRKV